MPSGFVNTSLLLNGDLSRSSSFWDQTDIQIPSGGAYSTYNPTTDPGFNSFTVTGDNEFELDGGERVGQRVLLSPGVNRLSYCSGAEAQGYIMYPEEDLVEASSYEVYRWVVTAPSAGGKYHMTNFRAHCLSPRYTKTEVEAALLSEMNFILDLQDNLFMTPEALPSGALYDRETGWLVSGYYNNYNNLQAISNY